MNGTYTIVENMTDPRCIDGCVYKRQDSGRYFCILMDGEYDTTMCGN